MALAACHASVPRHQAGLRPTDFAGSAGSSDAIVFDSESSATALALGFASGPETARASHWKDASLSIAPNRAAYARAGWAAPEQPSLSDARRLHIFPESDSIIYFRGRTYTTPIYPRGNTGWGQQGWGR